MGSLQQVIHILQARFVYNMWWQAIQRSHENFKTA